VVRTAVQLTLGAEGYAHIKMLVVEKAVAMTIGPLSDPRFNRERAGIIHEIFRDKMRVMSNVEFQDLLRPAFQEDEWILIIAGGGAWADCRLSAIGADVLIGINCLDNSVLVKRVAR
jgi:hypothetical protein